MKKVFCLVMTAALLATLSCVKGVDVESCVPSAGKTVCAVISVTAEAMKVAPPSDGGVEDASEGTLRHAD